MKRKTGLNPLHSPEQGFSMVEMLMAAFIMAIGILGLTMLMTLSVKSSTSGRTLSTAVQIAERILDEAETQGRTSLLFSKTSNLPTFPANNYFAAAVTLNYDKNGAMTAAADYFQAVTARAVLTAPVPQLGGLANITVTVTWTEGAGAGGALINRQVVISRRVSYATA